MAVEVVLYTRKQCHLCDIVRDVIRAAQRRHALAIELREIDIDENPRLREEFDLRVPVVSIAGREVFQYRVDQESFVAAVKRADDERPG